MAPCNTRYYAEATVAFNHSILSVLTVDTESVAIESVHKKASVNTEHYVSRKRMTMITMHGRQTCTQGCYDHNCFNITYKTFFCDLTSRHALRG